jgi:hypothetical protein
MYPSGEAPCGAWRQWRGSCSGRGQGEARGSRAACLEFGEGTQSESGSEIDSTEGEPEGWPRRRPSNHHDLPPPPRSPRRRRPQPTRPLTHSFQAPIHSFPLAPQHFSAKKITINAPREALPLRVAFAPVMRRSHIQDKR